MLTQRLCAWASRTTHEANPKTWWLLGALLPAQGRRLFFALYAYFRWADDIIDAPDRDPAAVEQFCARQSALIRAALSGAPVRAAHTAEETLAAALRESREAPLVRSSVRLMWDALVADAQRGAAPVSAETLRDQIDRIGDAYTAALLHCLGMAACPDPRLWWLARAATATHHLRDLLEDRQLGYANIPVSDAARLGFAASAFSETDAARYTLARAGAVRAMFAQGRAGLRALPGWRARAVFAALSWRYERQLRELVASADGALIASQEVQMAG